MLTTTVALADKYNYLEPKFQLVYKFLRENDLAALPEGRIDIDGNNVYVMVQNYATGTAAEHLFEAHKDYFDVQYVISGIESFGYVNAGALKVCTPYDAKKDVMFFEEPEYSGAVILQPGDFITVAPEDAHAPRRQAGKPCQVKKLVFKVRV